jgi:quinol monooxygenase YgiN
MIRHIVMWKFKSENDQALQETKLKVKQLLESCRDCVPGIVEFEVGVASPGLDATYDVVLNSLFESRQAMDAYRDSPTHMAIFPYMASIRDARQCLDFETEPARQAAT